MRPCQTGLPCLVLCLPVGRPAEALEAHRAALHPERHPVSTPSGLGGGSQQRVGQCAGAKVISLRSPVPASGGSTAKAPGRGWALSWGLRGQGCSPTAASVTRRAGTSPFLTP